MFIKSWRRPNEPKYPEIWKRFEKTTKDGETKKFRIETMTDLYEDDLMEMYKKYFMPEETFHISSGSATCPEHLKSFPDLIKDIILKHQLTLLCVEDNEEAKPRLVGFNLCAVASEKEDMADLAAFIKAESTAKMMEMYIETNKSLINVEEKYGVDNYLGSLALAVHPDYRGLCISKDILLARIPVCKAMGLKLTSTLFTGGASQAVALKAGFVEDAKASYEEVGKNIGYELKYKTPYAKQMSLRIE